MKAERVEKIKFFLFFQKFSHDTISIFIMKSQNKF